MSPPPLKVVPIATPPTLSSLSLLRLQRVKWLKKTARYLSCFMSTKFKNSEIQNLKSNEHEMILHEHIVVYHSPSSISSLRKELIGKYSITIRSACTCFAQKYEVLHFSSKM
jgi:hypothetical protein